MKNLFFKPFSDFSSGVICDLLLKSYSPYPEIVEQDKQSWRRYDKDVFLSPNDGIGKCGFISCVGDSIVGFASWDPRSKPVAEIGHNCIAPQFQGKGYGKAQINEVLKRLKKLGFNIVKVSTGGGDLFIPSRKMYESCGFTEVNRGVHEAKPDFEVVYFKKKLSKE